MTKVYVVETGEYSDRHVLCVFSTEEKARQFVNKFSHFDSIQYADYEVDPEFVDCKDRNRYVIRLDYATGEISEIFDGAPESVFDVSPRGEYSRQKNGGEFYYVTGWFESEEQAVKVAAEMLAKHKYNAQTE